MQRTPGCSWVCVGVGGADLVIEAMGLGHRTQKREALTQLEGEGERRPRHIRRVTGLGWWFHCQASRREQ